MSQRISAGALHFDQAFMQDLTALPITNRERLAVVSRALQRAIEEELTPRQRELILMRYYQGMRPIDISRTLGVCPSTVTRTLRRGKRRLRKALRFYIEFLNCRLDE